MSVRRAQQEIDAREFAEWLAYYQSDPFGFERQDLGWGTVAATIANVFRGKGQRAMKPADFMPDFAQAGRRQTEAEMLAIFKTGAQVHNQRLKRNGRNRHSGS